MLASSRSARTPEARRRPARRPGDDGGGPTIAMRRAQVETVPRRCESMRRALRENALCALLATAGCATLAWLGLYGFVWSDYEVETQPSLEALVHGHLARFLAARARLRRLSDRARAVRLAARAVGRRRARRLPRRRRALPARGRGSRGRAGRRDACGRQAAARARSRARPDRREPDLAAGARSRPPRGTARRRAVPGGDPARRRRGGLAPPRARCRPAARSGDREQAVGADRGRPRAARTAVLAAPRLLRRRSRRRGGDRGAAARGGSERIRAGEQDRSRSGVRHLPAVAGLVVPRAPRRPRARPVRRRQARLSHRAGLDEHRQPPDRARSRSRGARAAVVAATACAADGRSGASDLRAGDGPALRAGHLGHRLLHGPRSARPHRLGGAHPRRAPAGHGARGHRAGLGELQLAARQGLTGCAGRGVPRLVAAARGAARVAAGRDRAAPSAPHRPSPTRPRALCAGARSASPLRRRP